MDGVIKVGFFGCGNVGGGVYRLMNGFAKEIAHRTGLRFEVKKVLVRDVNKKRDVELPQEVLTSNVNDLLEDDEISIILEFLGGCICPGLKLTSEALVSGTAKLPRFELVKPESVIGRTTLSNLQAGVIYGYIGQVDYLVKRFRKELNAPDALVVATGGMALMVAEETGIIDKLDGILTLKGLRLLYERNR